MRAWLPPGGHVEPNEDPVEAVVREALEETGLRVEVAPTSPSLGLSYPEEVTPPFTIMVEDIHDPVEGFHKHIDMIYFCRPVGGSDGLADGWRWVSRDTLEAGSPPIPTAGGTQSLRLRITDRDAGGRSSLGVRAIDFTVEGEPVSLVCRSDCAVQASYSRIAWRSRERSLLRILSPGTVLASITVRST